MAASSACPSAASAPSWKYDVFLSFRGEDTRRNFTDHLHTKLTEYGIKTFIDDQLRRGEQISPALLQAIEDSRISIIIFSQNYASSSWCLDELTKILECVHMGKHTAFPVFYDVDPSHVRKQRGSYAQAFEKHEEAYKDNMEKVVKWREALTEASGYSGWDSRDRHQSKVIKEIVFKIFFSKELVNPSSINKIGIDSRIETVLSLLCIGSHDVRMVGIWGMGGIGKTTIAEAIYERISSQFECCCFLSNVREKSKRIDKMQMELLSKILREKNLDDRIFNLGANSMKKALDSKKVLIVLDDVNHIEQLEKLAGHHDWFGLESRIIITTRDKRLLTEKVVDAIYEVKELERDDALMLFHKHAFKDESFEEDFKELCHRTLHYTKGNPLAIKILGSLLYKRTKKEWECELEKLKKFPNKDVQKVLRISFDGLEDTVKDIFLDIACFFRGENIEYVSELLKSCDLYPEMGISILIEKALITISFDNRLSMHDLIQEMGWEIVQQQSPKDPGKRSRLWLNEDIRDVLTKNKGTETIEGIVLDLSASEDLLDINVDVFTKMINLRVLKFRVMYEHLYYFREVESSTSYKMHGDFKFLSENLRYFGWEKYPLKSLPSDFDPRKLFELNIRHSRLEQIWEGSKSFPKLRYMNVSYSQDLIRIPDLSRAPELRKINLEGCISLVKVHSSIETLEKLRFLNLRGCSKLEEVAKSFRKLTSLESVDFSHCSKLRKLPNDLKVASSHLYLTGCSKLEELPQSIGGLTSLKTSNLIGCPELKRLSDNMGTSIVTLNLSSCSKLKELPKSIGELTSLKTLDLSNCSDLKKLPDGIRTSLQTLNLSGCSKLKELPENIGELMSLKTLNLSGCSELMKLPDGIGMFLQTLNLSGCSKLEELPKSIGELVFLKTLNLSKCSKLKKLPNDIGMSLETLNLSNCLKLEELPRGIGKLTSLETMDLCNCLELKKLPDDIGRLQRLEKLVADGSGIQEVTRFISRLTRLGYLSLAGCKGSGECTSSNNLALSSSSSVPLPRQGLRLPSFLGLELLHRLYLSDCNLQEGALPGDMSSLYSLGYLDLGGNSFITLPSLTRLTHLRTLIIEGCKSLQSLTELPWSIETVMADNCESLETFSYPMSKSDILKLDFSNCWRLVENEESSVNLEALLRGIRIIPARSHPWFRRYRSFGALVPGGSVPEWFIHRSEGNSIIVHQLPPYLHFLGHLGLGFCAVFGENLSQWHSDHLWFGYQPAHMISCETSSKRASHLKFSFSGYDKGIKAPLAVKECAIRLLYLPMRGEEKWNRLREGEIIEHETVNVTLFSPPPTFCEERCWQRTIEANFSPQPYWQPNTYEQFLHECWSAPPRGEYRVKVHELRLRIEVEGLIFPSTS